MKNQLFALWIVCVCICINGCTVISIVDAAVSTTVSVGSAVVGTAVDVTRAGVRAVTPSDDKEVKKQD